MPVFAEFERLRVSGLFSFQFSPGIRSGVRASFFDVAASGGPVRRAQAGVIFGVMRMCEASSARVPVRLQSECAFTRIRGLIWLAFERDRQSRALEAQEAANSGTLFVDCSTVDLSSARAAHAGLHDRRRDRGRGEGEISLSTMGKKLVHCGAREVGQAAKIYNNMILGISMIAVSEAFVLAEKLGL